MRPDAFWAASDRKFAAFPKGQVNELPLKRPFVLSNNLQRTPEWQEPNNHKSITASKQSPKARVQELAFEREHLSEKTIDGTATISTTSDKRKTRGDAVEILADPASRETKHAVDTAVTIFKVDARSRSHACPLPCAYDRRVSHADE